MKNKTEKKEFNKYSSKINSPIYKPRDKKPHISELVDPRKAESLIEAIAKSNISNEDKKFLFLAAYRHLLFNYEKIADYYAHSDAEVQKLMEDSALVIIDFDSAIEKGYVNVCEKIKSQFLQEYKEEINNE